MSTPKEATNTFNTHSLERGSQEDKDRNKKFSREIKSINTDMFPL